VIGTPGDVVEVVTETEVTETEETEISGETTIEIVTETVVIVAVIGDGVIVADHATVTATARGAVIPDHGAGIAIIAVAARKTLAKVRHVKPPRRNSSCSSFPRSILLPRSLILPAPRSMMRSGRLLSPWLLMVLLPPRWSMMMLLHLLPPAVVTMVTKIENKHP
jgi:hypothetical protein